MSIKTGYALIWSSILWTSPASPLPSLLYYAHDYLKFRHFIVVRHPHYLLLTYFRYNSADQDVDFIISMSTREAISVDEWTAVRGFLASVLKIDAFPMSVLIDLRYMLFQTFATTSVIDMSNVVHTVIANFDHTVASLFSLLQCLLPILMRSLNSEVCVTGINKWVTFGHRKMQERALWEIHALQKVKRLKREGGANDTLLETDYTNYIHQQLDESISQSWNER